MNIASIYAQALSKYGMEKASTEREGDAYVERFIQLLKRRGHYKLLPSILKELKKISESQEVKVGGTLTCADPNDVKRWTAQLKEYGIKSDTDLKVKIDKSLIGGFRYEGKDIVVDGCYRNKLLNLYREITT